MIFTPAIKEIYDSIGFSSMVYKKGYRGDYKKEVMKAYEEAYSSPYGLLLTIEGNYEDLCSFIPNNKNKCFYMENAEDLLHKSIETFVRTRRQRILETLLKPLIGAMISYTTLGKVFVEGANMEDSFYFNPAFREKALSYKFYKENPQSDEEADLNLKAMMLMGAEAVDVLEKYILSINIYASRFNKEYSKIKPNLTEEEKAKENNKAMDKIRSFTSKDYTNEDIDSFEKAVLSTFGRALYPCILAISEAVYNPSLNDYQTILDKAAKSIEDISEALMLTALKEIGEENSEKHRYTKEQAAFVVNCAQLKYDDQEEE